MTKKHKSEPQMSQSNAGAARRADDQPRATQYSHGDTQNRSKKDGHATQLGTGQDQGSSRQHGAGARRQS